MAVIVTMNRKSPFRRAGIQVECPPRLHPHAVEIFRAPPPNASLISKVYHAYASPCADAAAGGTGPSQPAKVEDRSPYALIAHKDVGASPERELRYAFMVQRCDDLGQFGYRSDSDENIGRSADAECRVGSHSLTIFDSLWRYIDFLGDLP